MKLQIRELILSPDGGTQKLAIGLSPSHWPYLKILSIYIDLIFVNM